MLNVVVTTFFDIDEAYVTAVFAFKQICCKSELCESARLLSALCIIQGLLESMEI